MRKLFFVIFLFSVLSVEGQGKKHQCQAVIKKFVSDKDLKGSSISLCIMNAKNGKIMASFGKERNLIPASTLKIITCATALRVAGDSFVYKTFFIFKGEFVHDSIFNGDIIIQGIGDPSFGSGNMKEALSIDQMADTLCNILKAERILEINGKIVVNSDYISDIPANPEWLYYDIANYYGTGMHGFNVLENSARLELIKSQELNQYNISKVYPFELRNKFQNKIKSVSYLNPEDKNLYFLGTSNSNEIELHGELGNNSDSIITLKSFIPDPANCYTLILQNQLMEHGIRISNMSSVINSSKEYNWFTNISPDLNTLVKYTLKNSVNLYSEAFVHLIGDKWFNSTNRNKSLVAIESYWNSKLKDKESLKMVDGSGLSRKNSMNAENFSIILRDILIEKDPKDFFLMLNDISKDGPLTEMFKSKKAISGTYRMKSGSMEGVKAYVGYLLFDGKPKYIISFIINNYSCKGKLVNEKIVEFLISLEKCLKSK